MKKSIYHEALEYAVPFRDIQFKDKHGMWPKDKLKELVDKADPERVIFKYNPEMKKTDYECPSCNENLNELLKHYSYANYCPNCRKSLNWEENEE